VSDINGWVGTGAGCITIAVCILATLFVHLLPAVTHKWVHRGLIVLMYCGATAVLVTTIGQFTLRMARDVTGWFGGVSTGIGFVAIVVASLFLLLAVVAALIKMPVPGAGYLAVVLVFMLALVPGGWLHSLFAYTAAPGQHISAQLATWIGG
jgi:hypothetical protein